MTRDSRPIRNGTRWKLPGEANQDPIVIELRTSSHRRVAALAQVIRSGEHGSLDATRTECRPAAICTGSIPIACYTLVDQGLEPVQVFPSQRDILRRPVLLEAFRSPCSRDRAEGDIA